MFIYNHVLKETKNPDYFDLPNFLSLIINIPMKIRLINQPTRTKVKVKLISEILFPISFNSKMFSFVKEN